MIIYQCVCVSVEEKLGKSTPGLFVLAFHPFNFFHCLSPCCFPSVPLFFLIFSTHIKVINCEENPFVVKRREKKFKYFC